MTAGMFFIICGAVFAIFFFGFLIDILLERHANAQVTNNVDLDFQKLIASMEDDDIPAVYSRNDSEDTGVIAIRDMARVFAHQDHEIGKSYVDSLKHRLILAGTYS